MSKTVRGIIPLPLTSNEAQLLTYIYDWDLVRSIDLLLGNPIGDLI